MTLDEASSLLGVQTQWLAKRCRLRMIRARKVKGAWEVDPVDLAGLARPKATRCANPTIPPGWVTVATAARALNQTTAAIMRRVKRRRLEHVDLGPLTRPRYLMPESVLRIIVATSRPGSPVDDHDAEPADVDEPQAYAIERPRRRGDCADGPRPCPWLGCRYHMALRIRRLSITVDPAFWAGEMRHTCALDVAAEGEHTLEAVGDLWGLSRERIRQIEQGALSHIGEAALVTLREYLAT